MQQIQSKNARMHSKTDNVARTSQECEHEAAPCTHSESSLSAAYTDCEDGSSSAELPQIATASPGSESTHDATDGAVPSSTLPAEQEPSPNARQLSRRWAAHASPTAITRKKKLRSPLVEPPADGAVVVEYDEFEVLTAHAQEIRRASRSLRHPY